MYIIFDLPKLDRARYRAVTLLEQLIYEWAEKYDTHAKTKIVKDTFRVILDTSEDYTMFGLTFKPSLVWAQKFRFHEPMSRPPNQKN